jgi:hypothetical protein
MFRVSPYSKYSKAMAAAAAPPMLPKALELPPTGTSVGPGVTVLEESLSVLVGFAAGMLVVPLTTTTGGGAVQLTGGTGSRVTISLVEVGDAQELQVTVELVAAPRLGRAVRERNTAVSHNDPQIKEFLMC